MKKNEIYTAEITDITLEGSGVCHIENMAVFVPNTALGDVAEIRIVKVLKNYSFGIVEQLLTPSPSRISPACSLKSCGGCTFQHMDYTAECKQKEKAVYDAFTRIGKLTPEFLPILGCEQRFRYRNKAQYPFSVDKSGKAILGFFAKHSHRVIPVTDCILQPELFREIGSVVLDWVNEKQLPVYQEQSHKGCLRHLYLRQGYHSKEVMVCFIVKYSIAEELTSLAKLLQEKFPTITSVSMNINTEKTNVIMGRKTQTILGNPYITDTMCGNKIQISPEAFYQVNTAQAERLYGIGKEFAQLTSDMKLMDLYCGAGTIGLSMAREVQELIGVEIVPPAVENAKLNAKANAIKNATFQCGDAGTIATKLAEEGACPDVICVDPPRKGCDEATIESVVTMAPKRVVMISCNPATAARDCSLFEAKGYTCEKVQAVDLFPCTSHVECVVLLTKR